MGWEHQELTVRLDGWDARLWAVVEAARDRPFAWGVHDCATWVADVRCALTGQDAAAAWRGSYSTARGAWRALRRRGHEGLEEAVCAVLGSCLASPLAAQRGDIVAAGAAGNAHPLALGVCMGVQSAFLGKRGLVWLPSEENIMAWRV